jgi:hypothetical protein
MFLKHEYAFVLILYRKKSHFCLVAKNPEVPLFCGTAPFRNPLNPKFSESVLDSLEFTPYSSESIPDSFDFNLASLNNILRFTDFKAKPVNNMPFGGKNASFGIYKEMETVNSE